MNGPAPIRVLVVEDDPVAADAHALYVGRVPGFTVAGVAHTCAAAVRALEGGPIDLVLLDLYLPDGHGLTLLRALRGAGRTVDVVAVTSARDLTVVRDGVALGVVQHVLKPFSFATLRERLLRYAEFRRRTAGTDPGTSRTADSQADVDRALSTLRAPGAGRPHKGLSAPTLERVAAALDAAGDAGLTAAGAAERLSVNRVTARRYLEHLATEGRATRDPVYGQVGRPEHRYRRAR